MEAPLLVHHARVASSVATRGDVERWLERVPVEGLGLDEGELFYVPRLRLRLPERGGIAATHMPDRILAALRQLLAGAESGWGRGFVPDRPYRFTSRSRYSAWLIRLWISDGSAAAREAFSRSTSHAGLVEWQRATLLRDGPALVATIARLAEIGIAPRWISRFEPADITLAQRAIEASFALPFAVPVDTNGLSRSLAGLEARCAPTIPAALLRETVAWLTTRGNDWTSLPEPLRALFLAAAILAQKPAIASDRPIDIATAIATVAAFPEILAEGPAARAAPPLAAEIIFPMKAGDSESQNAVERHRAQAAPSTDPAGSRHDAEPQKSPGTPEHIAAPFRAAIGQQFDPTQTVAAPQIRTPKRTLPATTHTTLLAPDARFSTGYGGLLFLLNAFIALGLYPDFTQPKGTRLQPSPLWLADRIGRYWFGRPYRRDPLANWIAAHAEGGHPPRTWHVQDEWLSGFETRTTPRLTRSRRRVTLWHPAGFPLFDGDERDRPEGHRHARMISRTPARLPLADRWPACLALYLNARLKSLAGTGLSLLAQPASIDVRDLDIRATFGLDRHPVELRLAGLDRNPGWQPAEGRSIAFAFE